MTRERGLNCDLRRLPIADLTDEDDVRVLPQDRAQAVREADVGQLVDLALIDVLEHVLDGVLDRHDVADLAVELVNRGVQGRRLAAARRPRDEHHPVRRVQQPMVLGVGVAGEAELAERDQRSATIEQPHDDLLAPDRLHRRDSHVQLTTVDVEADLAVLGATPLDDVHPGHDLDPRSESGPSRIGQVRHVLEHAVDPEPDA